MKLKTTLLIDMDYFLYRAAIAAEEEHDYTPDLTVIVGNFPKAKKVVEREVGQLMTRFDTDKVVCCFSHTSNFRKKIDPEYKGNRTKRKPCGYARLKAWAMKAYPSMIKKGLEADDVLGILATNGSVHNFVVISPDKDLQQIPGRLYNLKEEFTVTPESGAAKVWLQALCGDQTDGYKGCPGIGQKTAEKLLSADDTKEPWEIVVETFEANGLTKEDALRNLQLAKILQAENWDSKKQEPILINPQP